MPPHEIKGSAFVTLCRWTTDERGADVWNALLAALPEDDRAIVSTALPSSWYPEPVHARVLQATFDVVAERDVRRYEQIIAGATLVGVRSFARMVLTMASPAFVLRRAPTLWSVLRRGHATLQVEQTPGVSLLRYRRFPFFEDALYRHYFRALLGALVEPAAGKPVDVELAGHGKDWLDVRIPIG